MSLYIYLSSVATHIKGYQFPLANDGGISTIDNITLKVFFLLLANWWQKPDGLFANQNQAAPIECVVILDPQVIACTRCEVDIKS